MRDAVQASGLAARFPELDWAGRAPGIWGRAAAAGSSRCATATGWSCAGRSRSTRRWRAASAFAGRARAAPGLFAKRRAQGRLESRATERGSLRLLAVGVDDRLQALAARRRACLSSMISRSPLSLSRATRMPLSNVALPWRARLQFSALAWATFCSSAAFLAFSASSALLALFLEFLVLAGWLGGAAGGAARGAAAAASARRGRRQPRQALRASARRGWRRMFLSGTSGGGGLVAEDLAAVLVDPLPLGAGRERQRHRRIRASREGGASFMAAV